jgi:NAD(P)H dehydrogenase (quinone)
MSIIVTGASGQFGRAAAERLIRRVDPAGLILTTRKPEQLADLAAAGAQVRFANFDDPASLETAFEGGTRMLLISTARVGTRVGQHKNAIEAAVAKGVKHIAYTSVVNARKADNPAIVSWDHRDTELLVEGSGAAFTHLRDQHYAEAVAMVMAPIALSAGRLPGSAHDGAVAFVSREDCVDCAVAVLTTPGHENRAYDLTGPELLSIPKAMQMVSELSGRPITFDYVTDQDMQDHFDRLGFPRHASDGPIDPARPWSSDDMVSFERAIREGFFAVLSEDVKALTGKAPRPLREVLVQYQGMWPK